MSAELLGYMNLIVAGIAIPLALVGIQRMWDYFRKRHDTLLKTGYDVETLFKNVNNLKTSVDETKQIQEETTTMTKAMVGKLDELVESSKKVRESQQKLVGVLYKHDDQIRLLAEKSNIDVDRVARRHNLFDEHD